MQVKSFADSFTLRPPVLCVHCNCNARPLPAQDYLRDSPANDRTAQALQGLTFGGGGDGIGLRIGGLLQAQAQYGGDLAQQARLMPFLGPKVSGVA